MVVVIRVPYSQITFLRKSYGSRLNIFAPVDDLSALSQSQTRAILPGQTNDVAIFGGQVYGDEYADHVIKVSLFNSTLFAILTGLIDVESRWHHSSRRVSIYHGDYIYPLSDIHRSTLLKSDNWLKESQHVQHEVRGAINFRKVHDTQIYALGQPTMNAVDEVVSRIKQEHPGASSILWITLREEPIVYVRKMELLYREVNADWKEILLG
jgi:hypothetical protein